MSLLAACFDAWVTWQLVSRNRDDNPAKRSRHELEQEALAGLNTRLGKLLMPPDTGQEILVVRKEEAHSASKLQVNHLARLGATDKLTMVTAKTTLESSTNSLPDYTRQQSLAVLECREEAQASQGIYRALSDDNEEEEENFLFHVVGFFSLWDQLPVQSVSLSPLPCQGAPIETFRLLIGMPINPQGRGLVTPTAAAILKTLCGGETLPSHNPPPFITLLAVGLGSLDTQQRQGSSLSDCSRLLLGARIISREQQQRKGQLDEASVTWKMDSLIHMEANLDDITAESLAFAVELLLKNGALDAWVTPIVMKKGRAAHTLHCLCRDAGVGENTSSPRSANQATPPTVWETLVRLIFQHTTTLGVRIHRDLERIALRRSLIAVQTQHLKTSRKGVVEVKIGYLGNDAVSVKAEFDHCRDISLETGIPIQQIAAQAVLEAYAQVLNDHL
jgi:uncharacterized protein (DUF111 family)